MQQCCARACALVRFLTCNMSQHLATWWPHAHMLHTTVLGYVASKCCDRLAGACKCWVNNVTVCCALRNAIFFIFPIDGRDNSRGHDVYKWVRFSPLKEPFTLAFSANPGGFSNKRKKYNDTPCFSVLPLYSPDR